MPKERPKIIDDCNQVANEFIEDRTRMMIMLATKHTSTRTVGRANEWLDIAIGFDVGDPRMAKYRLRIDEKGELIIPDLPCQRKDGS